MLKICFIMFMLPNSAISVLQAEEVFLDEQFITLERWEPFCFPKIEMHSSYSTTNEDGASCLLAASSNSASAILLKERFNVYDFPNIAWRWKVSNVYKKGDCNRKDANDYPVRLYVMFKYEPENASFDNKVKYEIAKFLYGKYPPHSFP